MHPKTTFNQLHTPHTIAIGAILMAAAAGGLVYFSPTAGIATAAGLCMCAVMLSVHKPQQVWFLALVLALVGYAFIGRPMAYLGVSSIYVGELTLGLGVLTFISVRTPVHRNRLSSMLMLFIAIGTIQLILNLSEYRLLALRDSVVWGYALFAILLYYILTESLVQFAVRMYARIIPVFVIWAIVAPIVYQLWQSSLPHFPGTPQLLFVVKSGDMQVHLAGVAAFSMLGLRAQSSRGTLVPPFLAISAWATAVVINGSANRGGLVALIAACSVAYILKPSAKWILLVGFIGLAALVASPLLPTLDLGRDRTVSPYQIIRNLLTVFQGSSADAPFAGTMTWRIELWRHIISSAHSFHNFWIGQGFGPNIVSSAGFSVDLEDSVRSPHNVHLTILGRMGVPVFIFWVAIWIVFVTQLLKSVICARANQDWFWFGLFGWLLCYWIAMIVDGSFDVYIEGPQGGIWFWSVVGLAMASMRIYKDSGAFTANQRFPK